MVNQLDAVLVANIEGTIRYETLNGRNYLVAPLSMIVPGVLNGSEGNGYYPLTEIMNTTDAWNGMPIVVNHPVNSKGKGISARTPEVLEKQGIGTVFNSKTTNKLVSEGWFDIEKTNSIDKDIIANIEAGIPMELSTGLNLKQVKSKGVFNTKPYDWIGKEYKPDHLAVLPNKKGACSISDGCGVLVNEAGDQLNTPILNKLSHDDIQVRLAKAVRGTITFGIPNTTTMDIPSIWVSDVYDKDFIYEYDGTFYSRTYSVDKKTEEVTIGDDATKMVQTRRWVAVDNENHVREGNCEGMKKCDACKSKSNSNSNSKYKKKKTEMKIRPITNADKKASKKSGKGGEASCGIGSDAPASYKGGVKGKGMGAKGKLKVGAGRIKFKKLGN